MITLSDYLGSLMTSVNQARVLTDLESVKIAQVYAGDALLKHFPVPHFRARNVELEIPVAMATGQSQQQNDEYEPFEDITFDAEAYDAVKRFAGQKLFRVEIADKIVSSIKEASQKLKQALKAGSDKEPALETFSRDLAASFIKLYSQEKKELQTLLIRLRVKEPKDAQALLIKRLEEDMLAEINDKPEPSSNLQLGVITEAARLKEFRPEDIVRIKVSLSEEGLEMHTMENEQGELVSKLLPE